MKPSRLLDLLRSPQNLSGLLGLFAVASLALILLDVRSYLVVSDVLLFALNLLILLILIRRQDELRQTMHEQLDTDLPKLIRDSRKIITDEMLKIKANDHAAMERETRRVQANVEDQLTQQYRQFEALSALNARHKDLAPLTGLGGWAVAPDLALILSQLVEELKPGSVVELGSGTSTVIMASGLKQHAPEGRIVSLDHLKDYAEGTRRKLRRAGLDGFARVAHAPLKEHKFKKEAYQWYDLDKAELPKDFKIDLLVVDGPPEATNPQARYPALPLLEKYMSKHAVIVLDDFRRASEHELVDRWLKESKGWKLETIDTQKQTAILRRN